MRAREERAPGGPDRVRLFDKSLFREEAIASHGKTERLDVLPQVTAPHEWAVLAGLTLVLLGAGAWCVFGTIERRLTAECLLVRPGDRRAVLAELSGTVADVLVDTGDAVRSGQAVARVRRPELRRSIRLARARVDALEARPAGEREGLRGARAELADLELTEAVGDVIVSPWAGTVTTLALTPGQPVAAGAEVARVRTGTAGGLEAVAFIAPAQAAEVAAGMAARVLVPAPDGRRRLVLAADLREVAARPAAVPGWVAAFGLATPDRGHRVRLSLRSAPDRTVADGEPCRLDVVTRRQAPVRFLARAGSG